MSESVEHTIENPAERKVPLALKIFAGLNFVSACAICVAIVLAVLSIVNALNQGQDITSGTRPSNQAIALYVITIVVGFLLAAQFVVFSIRVIRSKRRGAARQANIMVLFAIAATVLALMAEGVGTLFYFNLCIVVYLLVMASYLDPSLAEERRLQIKLSEMEARSDSEAGVLGRDKTGKGYIQLNFFNIFWIFVVACVLGLLFESLVCPFLNGRIENRTGMLWGPFSPIYGVGAVLMTMALNRFYNKNPLIVFGVSAVIGGAFEYLVSWFFQIAFGILAWDYSSEPFNLDGRTDLFHAICWGVLGLLFIRFLLPRLLELINKIPWNWRYGVTTVFAAFMLVNAVMTMLAFDCWFQRVSGVQPETPVACFFAENFDNEYMSGHFQTMSIDPNRAARS